MMDALIEQSYLLYVEYFYVAPYNFSGASLTILSAYLANGSWFAREEIVFMSLMILIVLIVNLPPLSMTVIGSQPPHWRWDNACSCTQFPK